MPTPTSEEMLAELFRQLGAREPEQWARSQMSEGIPQLQRFLFLKSAWANVVRDGDSKWIDDEIHSSKSHPERPFAGLGAGLERCRQLGVADRYLIEIARCLQVQMLFNISYLMDHPGDLPAPLQDMCWGLFQVDDAGNPFGLQIAGLHESVLELEPTGREMRPDREA